VLVKRVCGELWPALPTPWGPACTARRIKASTVTAMITMAACIGRGAGVAGTMEGSAVRGTARASLSNDLKAIDGVRAARHRDRLRLDGKLPRLGATGADK